MGYGDSWFKLHKQPSLNGHYMFHALAVGQVSYLPDIAPLAESGIQGDHEREVFLAEQQQFLQTMAFLDELTGEVPPALDLRISNRLKPSGSPELAIAVIGRATSTDQKEAETFADQLWNRLSTAFPSSYGFEAPPSADPTFLTSVLPDYHTLEHARIWEIVKQPYLARYGDRVVETVGTYGDLLDSMITSWNGIAHSREPILLSIRCSPISMSDELRNQLDQLYHNIYGENTFNAPMRAQDAPLIEDARRRIENLLSTMQLMRMRIQVVSWGSEPTTVIASVKASLTTSFDPDHRSCECRWNERVSNEREQARDELAYVTIEETQVDDASWLQESHELMTVDEVSAAWRLPLARRYGISGVPFKRDPQFTPDPLPLKSPKGQSIWLGNVIGPRGNRLPQRLNTGTLAKHALILGEPGAGKSTTTQSIVFQLWNAGLPSMVIDPVSSEYHELWALSSVFRDGARSLCVFTPGASPNAVGDIGSTLAFNPFCPPACPRPVISLDAHIMTLKDCIGSALSLPDAWRELVGRAIRNAYQNLGWAAWDPMQNRQLITAADMRGRPFPTFVDLIKAVEQEISRYKAGEFRSTTEAGLLGRLRDMAAGPLGAIVYTHRPLDVARLIERPIVIELRAIRQADAKSLIILFLLTQLRQYYDSLPRSQELQHLVIVEEAHRLLSPSPITLEGGSNARAEAINVVVNMLAELRKAGVGMVLVEQLPSRLEETVVKLPSVKILHRLTAKDDRETLASAMNMSLEQTKYTATLLTGQAAFYSEGLVEPILLEIANPWGPEMNPPGRQAKPMNAQQQDDLERHVEEHTHRVWPPPPKGDTPWNPCTLCKCGCRPRLRMLESGSWQQIQLNDIITEAQQAILSANQLQVMELVNELILRVEKTTPKANDEECLCMITLALERYVRNVTLTNDRKKVKEAENTVDTLLRVLLQNLGTL